MISANTQSCHVYALYLYFRILFREIQKDFAPEQSKVKDIPVDPKPTPLQSSTPLQTSSNPPQTKPLKMPQPAVTSTAHASDVSIACEQCGYTFPMTSVFTCSKCRNAFCKRCSKRGQDLLVNLIKFPQRFNAIKK